jgi:hypothetical protein
MRRHAFLYEGSYWKKGYVGDIALSRWGGRIPGLSALILQNADALVRDPERFAQTGAGLVLRELSHADQDVVVAFAEEYAKRLSCEGMKYIVEKMSAADRKRLLDLHAAGAGSPKAASRS